MSKPNYRAYKPVNMTDGLHNWVQATFDKTVEMTPDDMEKLATVINGHSPNARLTRMQARLDGLQNITPAIKLHADAIRSIYAGLVNYFSVNREGLDALDKADDLWVKVMVLRDLLPKAIMGAKNSKTQQAILDSAILIFVGQPHIFVPHLFEVLQCSTE